MPLKTSIIVGLLFLLVIPAASKQMSSSEINYKAEFIVDLLDDVTWPKSAATDSDGSLVIGVVGKSSLTPRLKELAGERSKTRVKVLSISDDLTSCRVLFIATEDKTELAQILKKTKSVPVLTVGDAFYFARYGVMINFYTDDSEKIKFEVNTMTMGFVGIKLKSTLMELATVI